MRAEVSQLRSCDVFELRLKEEGKVPLLKNRRCHLPRALRQNAVELLFQFIVLQPPPRLRGDGERSLAMRLHREFQSDVVGAARGIAVQTAVPSFVHGGNDELEVCILHESGQLSQEFRAHRRILQQRKWAEGFP